MFELEVQKPFMHKCLHCSLIKRSRKNNYKTFFNYHKKICSKYQPRRDNQDDDSEASDFSSISGLIKLLLAIFLIYIGSPRLSLFKLGISFF